MYLGTTYREQSDSLENMVQICNFPKKVPSTSITHQLQSRDLKHSSKDDLPLTLPFIITLQSS